jgi:hypothetical protein
MRVEYSNLKGEEEKEKNSIIKNRNNQERRK